MEQIYATIWEKALPYYERGRSMDIAHIQWIMRAVEEVCQSEQQLDQTILMPLAILHDVGYAEVPKNNPFNLDIRKSHMQTGARIAGTILETVGYEIPKRERICGLIAVHDNWALGDDSVYADQELAVFNDLDFIVPSQNRDCQVADVAIPIRLRRRWLAKGEKGTTNPAPHASRVFDVDGD